MRRPRLLQVLPLLVAFLFLPRACALLPQTEGAGAIAVHPFTLDGCTAAAVHGAYANCDPVNLFFPGAMLPEVHEALQSHGWTALGIGSSQYLHFDDDVLVPQTLQLFLYEGLERRYHLRLWQAPDGTVGAVHHELGVLEHGIDMDWEVAEAFVGRQLCLGEVKCKAGPLLDEQYATQGRDQEWRGWANNARMTVITLR